MTRQFESNVVAESEDLKLYHPLNHFLREFNQGLRRREGDRIYVRIFCRRRVLPELAVDVIKQDNQEVVDLHSIMSRAGEIGWLPESPVASEFRHLIYKNLW